MAIKRLLPIALCILCASLTATVDAQCCTDSTVCPHQNQADTWGNSTTTFFYWKNDCGTKGCNIDLLLQSYDCNFVLYVFDSYQYQNFYDGLPYYAQTTVYSSSYCVRLNSFASPPGVNWVVFKQNGQFRSQCTTSYGITFNTATTQHPANGPYCGNGYREKGEACDGDYTCCNQASCTFASSSTVCRSSAGACDLQETCTGSSLICPPDAKSTAVCRAAQDTCDLPETCNGVSDLCPLEGSSGLRPSTYTCRDAVGECDVPEFCTGGSSACPPDVVSPYLTLCRPAAGPCDMNDTCDGSSGYCPDQKQYSGFQCADPSPCLIDSSRYCNGYSNECPTLNTIDGADCNPTNPCLINGFCWSGDCRSRTFSPVCGCTRDDDCDDLNGCTTDFCLANGNCQHTDNCAQTTLVATIPPQTQSSTASRIIISAASIFLVVLACY